MKGDYMKSSDVRAVSSTMNSKIDILDEECGYINMLLQEIDVFCTGRIKEGYDDRILEIKRKVNATKYEIASIVNGLNNYADYLDQQEELLRLKKLL